MIEKKLFTNTREMDFKFTNPSPAEMGPGEGTIKKKKIAELSQLLRILGAVVIISSASVFLIQHWETGNDLVRYMMLLVLTVLIALAGMFCGLHIRESKGARAFLGITLAVIPIHFAVLGGLIYSQFALDFVRLELPTSARWVAGSPLAALVMTAGALAVLFPLGYLSFLALARPEAKRLTLAFLTANMSLLLPYRMPGLIGLMVIIIAGAMAYGEQVVWRHKPGLCSREGYFIRVLMWAPVLLIIGRSSLLYAPDRFFLGAIWSSVTLLMFTVVTQLFRRMDLKEVIQGLSGLPAALAWNDFVQGMVAGFNLGPGAELPLFCLPFSGILILMSLYCASSGIGYRRVAVFIAVFGMVANLLMYPNVLTAFICLAVASATLAYGCFVEQIIIFLFSLAGFIFSLGYQLIYAVNNYSLGNWGSLAILGVAIIFIASLLERHHQSFTNKVNNFRKKIKDWDY